MDLKILYKFQRIMGLNSTPKSLTLPYLLSGALDKCQNILLLKFGECSAIA